MSVSIFLNGRRGRTVILITLASAGLFVVGCNGAAPAPPAPTVPWTPPTLTPPPGYSLTASPSIVAPGDMLRVTWTVPAAGPRDWIGLYLVGDAPCKHGWSDSTHGARSGSLSLTAPSLPGPYEFRYQPDNGCDDVVRSGVVTVVGGG